MRLDRDRLKTGLLLGGSFGFAALGQFYLFWRREYVWDGAIFMSIAVVCFALLIRDRSALSSAPRIRQLYQQRIGIRQLTIGLALVLNYVAARLANTNPPPNSYALSAALWVTSLMLFSAPFVSLDIHPRHVVNRMGGLRTRLRRPGRDLLLVSALLLAGLLLRIWNLEQIPANLSGDEGTQGLWAVDVLEGRLRNPFATGWFTVPTMSFFAQAASLRLFGDHVAGLRTLSALSGTATLLFTYLLARRTLGRRIGLLSLALLTFNHYHIHFSRLGSNQIADPLFMTLTLWLLFVGLERAAAIPEGPLDERSEGESRPEIPVAVNRRPTANAAAWFLAAGLTMGMSWYGYFGSRVILLTVVAYLGWQALTERGFLRRHAHLLALMALLALLAASPLLFYYARQPENFTARFNQVSFFHWLENELARPEHASTLSLVLRQVWRSISAFNHTLDPTFWYRAQIPLLDFVSGIFFVFGSVFAITKWRRPGVRLVLIWFGLTLLFGWVLTENPPSSMRAVIIAPAVAILAALGLDKLLALAHQALGGPKTQLNFLGLTLLAIIAVLNVQYYFFIYTPTRVYGNPNAERGTVLANYLRDRGDQPFVYFFGPPFLYYEFGTIRFITRDVPGVNVPPKEEDPNFHTRVAGPTLFVVLRERREELATIQARHPNGHLDQFRSEADGRLMFEIYEVNR
jgi:4-amino-4-deoxy-L-arabinose transferase-like glycosyltransferase